jgi:hypothetical protein
MLPIGWQDRKAHKKDLSKWLDMSPSIFAISVKDSQEVEDIDEWLKGRFDGGLVTSAIFTSDSEILKYELLEMLAYGLGVDKFVEFMKQTENIPALNPISISQSVGDGAKAKNEIEYENITQKANIFFDGATLQQRYYFERNIFSILASFCKDIQKIADKNKTLLVIKFNKFGHEDKGTGSDFFIWFQEQFLSRMSQIQNLKVCIVFQGNIDRLTKINDGQKIHIKTLNLQDILEATKEHLAHHEEFCNGVIDPDSNTVEYNVFKRKFHARMRKLIQETQND